MRHALGGVDADGNAELVSRRDHIFDRIDGPQRVRDMRHRDDPRPLVEQPVILLDDQLTFSVDRDHAQFRTALLGHDLPRNDVRVVLHLAHEYLVAFVDEAPAV
jgi:hypothetical protein